MKTLIKQSWFVYSFFIGLGFLLYYKVLYLGFFSDDYHMLSVVASGKAWWQYLYHNIVGERGGGTYAPLQSILFLLQYKLFSYHAFWFHVVSVYLYSSSAYLVYRIVYRLSYSTILSCVSGIYFISLHIHLSALAWVAVQPHILATFFFLVSWYCYIVFRQDNKKSYLYVSIVAILCSLLSKEIALFFVAVFFVTDILFFCPSFQKTYVNTLIRNMAVYAVLIISFLYIRFLVVGYVFGYYAVERVSFDISRVFFRVSEYIVSMFLSMPYRMYMMTWYEIHSVMVWLLVIICLIVVIVLSRIHRRIILLSVISFAVMSIPFWSVQLHPFNNGGERYSYLLSVFFVIALTTIIYALSYRFRHGLWYFTIVMLCIIATSLFQLFPKFSYWEDAKSMRDTIIADFDLFDVDPLDFIIVTALPDNIYGAELMRNALGEMIAIESKHGFINVERMPFYTEFNKKPDTRLVTFHRDENKLSLEAGTARIFTGFGYFEHESGKYSMRDFKKVGSSGTAIDIDMDSDFFEQYGQVYLAYFDGMHMEFMSLK